MVKRSATTTASQPRKGSRSKRRKSSPKPPDDAVIRLLQGKEKVEDEGEEALQSQPDVQLEPDAQTPPSPSSPKHESAKTPNKAATPPLGEWSKPRTPEQAAQIHVTVILDKANLETVTNRGKTGGSVLLNCDDHRNLLLKSGRDANEARPDITHQCLLALQDSPLNKAGKLKVYIRTASNVLIDVHPQTRIPRTIKRFSGLMTQLLQNFKVRGTTGSTPLFKVIRNPVTSHLPVGAHKIVCTYNTENVLDIRQHAFQMTQPEPQAPKEGEAPQPVNIVYVVGAMAHGKVTHEWADDYICISEYPLSAATVCSRITYAYESLLSIM